MLNDQERPFWHSRPCTSHHGPSALPPQAFGLTSGKGGLVRLGCWTANSSFWSGQNALSNVRRTDAVLLLRRTAALVGPAGPFPPIRPKACRSIALSVRATAAKYLSPCYWKGISWYGRSLLFRDVREMMISGAETSLSAPKLRSVKCAPFVGRVNN